MQPRSALEDALQHAAKQAAALLLLTAAAQHTAEHIAQDTSKSTGLSLLGRAGEHTSQHVIVHIGTAFRLAQYLHDDGGQYRHELHDLTHAQSSPFTDLVGRHLLAVAQDMAQDAEAVG